MGRLDYVEEEYEVFCGVCAGSGEGMHEGERCWACRGTGIARDYEAEEDAAAERADRLNDEAKYDISY